MIFEQKVQPISFVKENTKFEFLPTGDAFQFLGGNTLINQMLGNTVDGSINNIYIRVYNGEEMTYAPLLGIKSESAFSYNADKAVWTGEFQGVHYTVTFTLATESVWFWSIDVEANGKTVDFIYAQDLGVGDKGAVVTNELYLSQYLDHKVIEGENGFVVSSRQNQGGVGQYVQQGSLNTKIVGYSTDAMQFFGKQYKLTNEPAALKGDLENVNYQFELSYTALQTEKISVDGQANVVFYGVFKPTHPLAVTEIEFADEVKVAFESLQVKEEVITIERIEIKPEFNGTIVSEEFTAEDVMKYFPNRIMEEIHNDDLYSFFTPDHSHIVLQQKEMAVERPHGHIITTGINEKEISHGLITSTNYMYGIFNAQVVCGNTTLNKLLSTTRGLLNILKNSGQRMYVNYNGKLQLLTMPAAYELGVNYAKWYYKFEKDMIVVTSYAAANQSDIIFEVKSENNVAYEFLVTNQLVTGDKEFDQPTVVEQEGDKIVVKPMEDSFLNSTYPGVHYNMNVIGTEFALSDDSVFYVDGQTRNGSLMTIKTEATDSFRIVIQGRLEANTDDIVEEYSLETEKAKFAKLYNNLTNGFKLTLDGKSDNYEIEKINEIFWWYTHNAMTHYAVPHGLEQPGGAAWGTRDVCQGPMEYFLMTQHYELARNVVEEIFSHQFMETGEWPQWFMFDKYNMQQDDSHGDVVFWPLKTLGDYIRITGDVSILEKEVVYRHFPHGQLTEKETILSHVKKAMESIEKRFLYDTALISYDGGDWDDTLQPAKKELAEKLVSAWTVALAYQSIKQLGEVSVSIDAEYATKMTEMATKIKDSFDKFLIKDEVIAGFAYCEDADNIEYMLHPDDKKTGINYRLLPMTRSIIAELVDADQAKKNVELIDEHLMCPDGARLMNRPANYVGGVIKFFQRAEQASNVGREIGLQYVHAHIRFIEAMAKLGSADKAWKGMFTINPINITEEVPNAMIRQSNTYFSSSDGAFNSRYDFQDNFGKLRTGDVQVKGGWRIYSSGPGIYLNQIVSNVLGLRFTASDVIIDPVIPAELSGLKFDYKYNNTPISIIYNVENEGTTVDEITVNGTVVKINRGANPYRNGGVAISKDVFETLLKEENTVVVTIK